MFFIQKRCKIMFHKITIANQKGGVGKTAISANLAYFLTEDQNHKDLKILFIDVDVQGNASSALKTFTCGTQTYRLLTESLSDNEVENVKKLGETNKIVLFKASKELANSEGLNIKNCVLNLTANLKRFEDNFDLVIFDTPPTLGNALTIVLCCSQSLIVPIELDSFSLQGLESLSNTVRNLRENVNSSLDILGLVINKYFKNRKRLEELSARLAKTNMSNKIFDTKIHFTDLIPDALTYSQSLRQTVKNRNYHGHRVINEFKALTREVLGKIYGD